MAKSKRMRVIPYYDNLSEALEKPHCALCRLNVEGADRYIDSMLYAMVNDPDSRDEMRASRGFCHNHAKMFIRTGGALGVTILMDSVVRKLLDVVDDHATDATTSPFDQLRNAIKMPRTDASDALISELSPQIPCPVCSDTELHEKSYADVLLTHMVEPKSLAEAFRQSDGLCLPHFKYVLHKAKPGKPRQILMNTQQEIWRKLQAELAEFIRKSDHRFTHEPIGEEGDAWQRALGVVSGPPMEAFWQPSNPFNRRS